MLGFFFGGEALRKIDLLSKRGPHFLYVTADIIHINSVTVFIKKKYICYSWCMYI